MSKIFSLDSSVIIYILFKTFTVIFHAEKSLNAMLPSERLQGSN